MWARWYGPIVERFREWADAEPDVRAAIIVGSQARTDMPADEWSDLDIVLFHSDPARLIASTEWFPRFGTVVLSMLESTAVGGSLERRVLYADGRDVDFAIFPAQATSLIVGSTEGQGVIGRGFVILLDKDRQLSKLQAAIAGRRPEPPKVPTEAQFNASVADFWYHVLWAAKKLRRGEVWIAKMGCDGYLKQLLVQMIEWHAVGKGDRKVDVWHNGRFLDRWAGPEVRSRLPATFAQYDPKSLARALSETGRLYSDLARQVAAAHKWTYPAPAEEAVVRLTDRTLEGLSASG